MEWAVGNVYVSGSPPCMLLHYSITSFSPSCYLEEPIKKHFSVSKESV